VIASELEEWARIPVSPCIRRPQSQPGTSHGNRAKTVPGHSVWGRFPVSSCISVMACICPALASLLKPDWDAGFLSKPALQYVLAGACVPHRCASPVRSACAQVPWGQEAVRSSIRDFPTVGLSFLPWTKECQTHCGPGSLTLLFWDSLRASVK
jgi:hypothetical protein